MTTKIQSVISNWMEQIKKESGKRLRKARNDAGLTLQQVIDKIPGLTIGTLNGWELGSSMVNVEKAKLLAKLYDISAGYLLTLEDAPITKLESQVLYLLRQTDQRGQESVYRVAEAESAYAGRREDEAERRDDDPAAQCG